MLVVSFVEEKPPEMSMATLSLATPKLPMKIIVAMDTSLGIGKNGEVPWYLAGDLCRFRRLTTTTEDPAKQNAVLMGRRVWESIPEGKRPLNKRLNVVLSTTMAEPEDGSYLVARSFQGALDMLNGMSDKIETIWNIGGYRVYEEGLKSPQLYQMALTFVDGDFGADVVFPHVDMEKFVKLENGEDDLINVERGIRYRFETFQSLHYVG
ncbi:Dihydrofolate reductase [Toxocara canis]|uniref:dihydrofolate reductase n=1 Tax=Toxocara canis TaxID=6265 RepID=A0A0B2UQL3_TOXCA|nr:Dihydrofolate reductase [Toxocara canis]